MANVYVNETSLQDIADSIRTKNGTQNTYKPGQMAAAIDALPSGGITPTGTLEVTANGTYDVTNYASAEVDVPTGSTPVINPLSVTENGTYTAPSGVDGYSPVTVNVPSSGHVFSALPVTIKNGRTGTIAVNRITYSYNGHPLFGFGRSNVAAGATLTVQDMAYDGTYVFFNSGAGSSISYNGETATFERNGANFMLQIPDDYDSSIPFIVT